MKNGTVHRFLVLTIALGAAGLLHAQSDRPSSATFGELRVRTTIHSVGIEWDLAGDTNHNASCTVQYRVQGSDKWRQGLSLLRIDYRGWYVGRKRQAFRHFNMLAGSLMFLKPGSTYEVKLSAADPDGGKAEKLVIAVTRAVPVRPKPGRTLHVTPGERGGDGSAANPFRGIAAAEAVARPGDTLLLHAGRYSGLTLTKGGVPGKHIVWKAAGDGPAVLQSTLGVAAGHVWIDGLTFQSLKEKDFGGVRGKRHALPGLVVVRNTFRNCRYALSNTPRVWNGDYGQLNTGWYFADNVVEGGPWTEYATRLYMVADSDFCYNRVTTTLNKKGGDGFALRFFLNCDAYNNDLREIDDDGFEPDSAYGNIRIYRNRLVNPRYQAVSFQPMLCSPWFILRNEFVLLHPKRYNTPFKTNVFDRFVFANNTLVVRGRYGQYRADAFLRTVSRNNLWIYIYDNPSQKTNPTGAIWAGEGDRFPDKKYTIHGQTRPDWKTDTDYDGFSWEGERLGRYPFWWNGARPSRFRDLASFAKTVGIETHGVELKRTEVLGTPDVSAYAAQAWSDRRLTLKVGCKAVDAGAPLPNLCEEFTGRAPDLGAYELGMPLPHYGPRP